MNTRFGTLALAAGSLLSVVLIGCNPPIDEKKTDSGTPAPSSTKTGDPGTMSPAPTPAPSSTKAGDPGPMSPAPTPSTESPKVDDKPADATPAPKEEMKKDEPPKAA